MKKIRQFFWICSGSNLELIEQSKPDQNKYASIGATVFFTGLLAAISGGYAIYFVFENIMYSLLFGLVWGTMIFNLDRFIVSSMKKKSSRRNEWGMAFPRIVLAIIIAMVISKPLEIKIFEKEIESELEVMQLENIQKKEGMISANYIPELERLRLENENLQTEIKEKEMQRDTLALIAQKEADGTGGTMRRNAGPIYRIKKADADKAQQELEQLMTSNNGRINDNLNRISQLETQAELELSSLEHTRPDGLAGRLDALDRLTQKSGAIWLANWFIILLFMAIETAPVFVKILSAKGPYDYLIEKEEHMYLAESKAVIARTNTDTKEAYKKLLDPEKSFLVDELENSLKDYKR